MNPDESGENTAALAHDDLITEVAWAIADHGGRSVIDADFDLAMKIITQVRDHPATQI